MSVKKNFLYNLSYQLLLMILPFITTPYISRVIGAEGVGIQAYTISIANYFVLFAMLGINNHGNRSKHSKFHRISYIFFTFFLTSHRNQIGYFRKHNCS